jgi:hypothetical protein
MTATVTAPRTITVDHSLTLEQMIAAGNYDWVNSEITAECFPVKEGGTEELIPEIVHFGRDTPSSEAVVVELDKRGLRPGDHAELLAFGAAYPDEQRKYPIVALGSSAQVSGRRYVLCLGRYGSRRHLNLDWWSDGWDGDCRFLAFRKVSGT